jgi:hypothetical protein
MAGVRTRTKRNDRHAPLFILPQLIKDHLTRMLLGQLEVFMCALGWKLRWIEVRVRLGDVGQPVCSVLSSASSNEGEQKVK